MPPNERAAAAAATAVAAAHERGRGRDVDDDDDVLEADDFDFDFDVADGGGALDDDLLVESLARFEAQAQAQLQSQAVFERQRTAAAAVLISAETKAKAPAPAPAPVGNASANVGLEQRVAQGPREWDSGVRRVELVRRRSELVRTVVRHVSPMPFPPVPPSPSLSHPLDGSSGGGGGKDTDPSDDATPAHRPFTLHRILHATFPPSIAASLVQRYETLCSALLDCLGSGDEDELSSTFPCEAEPRDLGWRHNTHRKSGRGEARIEWPKESVEEENEIQSRLAPLVSGVGNALVSLAAVFLDARQADRLCDVIAILTSLALSEPSFPPFLLSHPFFSRFADRHSASAPASQAHGDQSRRNAIHVVCEAVLHIVASPSAPPPWAIKPSEKTGSTHRPATQARRLPTSMSSAIRRKAKDAKLEPGGVSAGSAAEWDPGEDAREELCGRLLDLLDVLAWEMDEDTVHSFRTLFDTPGVLFALLDKNRPVKSVQRTVRLLMLLATRPTLFRSVLEARLSPDQQAPPLYASDPMPILRLLSHHIRNADSVELDQQRHELHLIVVTFLSMLTVKHPEAVMLVGGHASLVPSLVFCIGMDTNFLWQDDGLGLTGSNVSLEGITTRISYDIQFLHRLFVSESSAGGTLNLRSRHFVPEVSREANGVLHMFTVAIGRLSFAPAPEWMEGEPAWETIEAITDLCRDLLDMIATPDEADAIFELLDPGESGDDDESQTDDEETEARNALPSQER